jgi:hypothetical protein
VPRRRATLRQWAQWPVKFRLPQWPKTPGPDPPLWRLGGLVRCMRMWPSSGRVSAPSAAWTWSERVTRVRRTIRTRDTPIPSRLGPDAPVHRAVVAAGNATDPCQPGGGDHRRESACMAVSSFGPSTGLSRYASGGGTFFGVRICPIALSNSLSSRVVPVTTTTGMWQNLSSTFSLQ